MRRLAESARRFARGERGRLRPEQPGAARTEVDQVAEALDEAFAARWRAEDQMRDFIADASHELRTPLAAVYGWADLYHELARTGVPSPAAAEEVVGHIRRETDRMNRLVDEMLALARLESQGVTRRESVDVAGLVADLVAETAALHPSHRVEPLVPVRHAMVETSEAVLDRAVRNLLVNAVVHTPPGTAVRTTVTATAQGGVRIEVSDSGPGLTPEELAHAGERFWRAAAGRQRGGGSGLGLAIVRQSAKSLGGTLTLGASEERGLRATIDLPQAIVSEPPSIPQDSREPSGGPRR
jgi:two-component system OmpR family sensor kinase